MSNAKLSLLEIVKWLLVLALVIALVLSLVSGGDSPTDFETMRSAVLSSADLTPMEEGSNQTLKRLYGLDAGDFEAVLLCYPATNMGAEELLLVKLSDKAQQQEVEEAIRSRIQEQMDIFEGYGVSQYEMLAGSVVEVRGNYVLFCSAADPAPVQKAFLDAL